MLLDTLRPLAISSQQVVTSACSAAFGRPLVTNVLRAMLVEAMVANALTPGWRWCAADYQNWDFESAEGLKLEVKQSAARQSWASATDQPSRIQFDIAARTHQWVEGAGWAPAGFRFAEIYILAHNPIVDEHVDHRDPRQWLFHVVAASRLPSTKTISLRTVGRLTQPVVFEELAAEVASVASVASAECRHTPRES